MITENLELLTIVWLDPNLDQTTIECTETKSRLRTIINYLKLFSDPDECVDFITSVDTEKIFFIVSGTCGKNVIPLICQIEQITFIYVFCHNKEKHDKWAQLYPNVRVYNDSQQMMQKIELDVKIIYNNQISISIFESDQQQKSLRNLTNESATFMWFQLFIEVVLRMSQPSDAKYVMLNECREQYENNEYEQLKIDQFERDYTPNDAIKWYTRDCFVYRLLNKAFRTEDIDIMFKYRFFIIDLYNQLRDVYLQYIQTLQHKKILIVYRGQHVTAKELKKLQDSVGHLLSMNSFLSTTTDRDVALLFAGDGSQRPHFESILFEVTIHIDKLSTNTKPFADIEHFSFMKTEQEILFAMGSVFRLESVEEHIDNLWTVKLTLATEENQEVMAALNYKKQEFGRTTNILTLGVLLTDMGEYKKAERYFRRLLQELPPDHENIASVYLNLARLFDENGDYPTALTFYQKSLKIKLKTLPKNDRQFSTIYNNIGIAYLHCNDLTMASKNLEKAFELEYQHIHNSPDWGRIASTLNSLIIIHGSKGNHSKVREYVQMHNFVRKCFLPTANPSGIASSNTLALYSDHDDPIAKITHLEQTLKTVQQTLPPTHPWLSYTYMNIGSLYGEIGHHDRALTNLQTALDILLVTFSSKHPSIGTIYFAIGEIYSKQADTQTALDYYLKANEIHQTTLRYDDPVVVMEYEKIALIYKSMSEEKNNIHEREQSFEKGYQYMLKFVEANLHISPPHHLLYITNYDKQRGEVYKLKDDKEQLMKYYKETRTHKTVTNDGNYDKSVFTDAITKNNLAIMLSEDAVFLGSMEFLEASLNIIEDKLYLSTTHPLLISVKGNLDRVKHLYEMLGHD